MSDISFLHPHNQFEVIKFKQSVDKLPRTELEEVAVSYFTEALNYMQMSKEMLEKNQQLMADKLGFGEDFRERWSGQIR